MRGFGSAVLALFLIGCESGAGDGDTDGPAVKTIGPEGGEAKSSDNVLTIIIPPGALSESIELEIRKSSDAPPSIGDAYQVSPERDLALEATVIYDWFNVSIEGRDPNLITIGRDIGAAWEALERVSIDYDARTVECLDGHISFHYGLIEAASIPGDTDTDSDTDTDTGDTTPATDTMADTEPMTTTSDPTTVTDTTTTGPTSETDTTSATDTGLTTTTGMGTTGDPVCGDGAPQAGEVCYIEGLAYASPAGPSAVVAADLDGDTNVDLVVAGSLDDAVSVRFGNGAGILFGATTYGVGLTPLGLTMADLDGGGDDLIVASSGDSEVGVLLANGDGTFGAYNGYGIGGLNPFALAIGDIDENTDLDVVTANSGSMDVSIMLGGGDGTLSSDQEVNVGGAPGGLGLGDFNGNLHLDLVTVVGSDLVLNAGMGGSFGPPSQTAVGAATLSLAIEDWNGDTDLDAAVADVNDNVSFRPGTGVGAFGAASQYAVGANPVALLAADVSGDGELDILSVAADDGTLTVLVGNGAGSFDESFTFAVGDNPSAVALGDFNGEGVPDIAVTNMDDDDTTLLLSDP